MELVELAQNYFGNTRSGSLVGPIGAFMVAALAVTTVLLIRNMNSRLRRLPERFPAEADHPTEPGEAREPGERGEPGEPPAVPR